MNHSLPVLQWNKIILVLKGIYQRYEGHGGVLKYWQGRSVFNEASILLAFVPLYLVFRSVGGGLFGRLISPLVCLVVHLYVHLHLRVECAWFVEQVYPWRLSFTFLRRCLLMNIYCISYSSHFKRGACYVLSWSSHLPPTLTLTLTLTSALSQLSLFLQQLSLSH